jgi:sulfite reductase alpha subunit-like flavoprotein
MEILPSNDDAKVQSVLEALKMPGDDVYAVSVSNAGIETYIPEKVSIRQLFKQYLDLNRAPTHGILRAFLTCANEEGTAVISEVLDRVSEADFERFVQGRDISGIIVQLAAYGVPALDVLVSSLPHVVPERFAISSPSTEQNTSPEIMVQDGTFCADFLAREATKKVPIKLGMMPVMIPRDAPIILAASGVGFSAIKPLLQLRDSECAMAMVLFECPNKEVHAPIISFLEDFKQKDLVDDVFIMPDDEGKPLVERLRDYSARLWEYWQDPRTQLFCAARGEETLAEALRVVLLEASIGEARMPKAQAELFCQVHPCVAYML